MTRPAGGVNGSSLGTRGAVEIVATRRPLDRLRTIKVKLGVVIVASVVASLGAVLFGWRTGVRPRWLVLATGLTALGTIQFLAHGMTRPLREMATASRALAAGDYSVRVATNSADEVGELAAAFNAMSAQLARVDADRRALIGNVSHELRTPLAGARAKLENIVDGVEPASPEQLASVLRALERMGRLVDDLLDLSRLESGVMPMRPERVALHDVVDAVVEEMALTHPGVVLRVEVGEIEVTADPQRLHQVLTNLVANAARHGGTPVTIEARRTTAGVRIDVVDTGPGIDEAERAAVFDRFHRASSTTGGTGLGLAIARWIVELNAGTIRVEPNHPTGCRAIVNLPAHGGPPHTV